MLAKMPPANIMPRARWAEEDAISMATRAKRRAEARAKAQFLPDATAGPQEVTSEDRLAAVIETASLNEAALWSFCRRRAGPPARCGSFLAVKWRRVAP